MQKNDASILENCKFCADFVDRISIYWDLSVNLQQKYNALI